MPLGPAPQGGQAAVLGVHSAEGRPGEWADPGVTRGTAEKERLRSSLCSLAWTSLHSFGKEGGGALAHSALVRLGQRAAWPGTAGCSSAAAGPVLLPRERGASTQGHESPGGAPVLCGGLVPRVVLAPPALGPCVCTRVYVHVCGVRTCVVCVHALVCVGVRACVCLCTHACQCVSACTRVCIYMCPCPRAHVH